MTWHKAMSAEALWEGDVAEVEVGGRPLMLVRLAGGEVRAYQARCPHQGASLASGDFDGRYLSCSAHAWRFDLATGLGVNPASCSLAQFAVSIRDQTIFVHLEES
jgi:toluene monooxygenase system ferredoxin subunit